MLPYKYFINKIYMEIVFVSPAKDLLFEVSNLLEPVEGVEVDKVGHGHALERRLDSAVQGRSKIAFSIISIVIDFLSHIPSSLRI